MQATICCFGSLPAFFLLVFSLASATPNPSSIGIDPLEEEYFMSEVIDCKDGSGSFSRDRLNDGYCDCVDGTDEPGTSACPQGRFYCRNVGSTPKFLFSSRVNDLICDCCDGSDEHDTNIYCPNTCIVTGNGLQKKDEYAVTKINSAVVNTQERSHMNSMEDLIQKLGEFKILLIVELVLLSFILTFGFLRHGIIVKRRRR